MKNNYHPLFSGQRQLLIATTGLLVLLSLPHRTEDILFLLDYQSGLCHYYYSAVGSPFCYNNSVNRGPDSKSNYWELDIPLFTFVICFQRKSGTACIGAISIGLPVLPLMFC